MSFPSFNLASFFPMDAFEKSFGKQFDVRPGCIPNFPVVISEFLSSMLDSLAGDFAVLASNHIINPAQCLCAWSQHHRERGRRPNYFSHFLEIGIVTAFLGKSIDVYLHDVTGYSHDAEANQGIDVKVNNISLFSWFKEERDEYLLAVKEGDVVGMIDAALDLMGICVISQVLTSPTKFHPGFVFRAIEIYNYIANRYKPALAMTMISVCINSSFINPSDLIQVLSLDPEILGCSLIPAFIELTPPNLLTLW